MNFLSRWALVAALGLASLEAADEPIDFNTQIRPILSNKCVACHGPDEEERKADLRLDTFEGATGDLGGYAAIVPENAEDSELVYRIETSDPIDRMPPDGKGEPLTPEETALVRRWIEEGAEYEEHWAYQVPERPELPAVKDTDWPHNAIDHFVLRRLEKEGLTPAPQADRWTLARRAAIDLTGLPPTPEEARTFVDDPEPGAYERYVKRLLAKPAFGERWARVWLDLARYADSAGYADDPPRTIWAYRDYVIRSLNKNKPFDRFTIEQIAGDLLDDPGPDELIATAFHRNTLTNNEGGTNDEEFRNVAVVDRVNTTFSVWMGTTMACAQCHTHKYDPITHLEYFQLFDFFNQSADADKKDESPLFEVWSDEQQERRDDLAASIASLKSKLDAPSPEIDRERAEWAGRWRSKPLAWQAAAVASLEAKSAELSVGEDGWIRAVPGKGKDTYTLRLPLPEPSEESGLRGIRLEVSPRQANNFVLQRVRAVYEPDESAEPKAGRFVRVELPGEKRTLHLAEVEVFSGGENIARGAAAKASSLYNNAVAARAVDGNTDGNYRSLSVFHAGVGPDPWLEIDLGAERPIDEIVIWNRTDGGKAIVERLQGYRVRVLDAQREVVFEETPADLPSPSDTVSLSGRRSLAFARASASHEQGGFPAAAVLGASKDDKGWAIAGGTGRSQELLLSFDRPLEEKGGAVVLTLPQESPYDGHTLRDFRLSWTGDDRLGSWIGFPAGVRHILSGPDEANDDPVLVDHFQKIAPALADDRKQLASMEKELAALKPTTTVPVMRDLPDDKNRETHVHLRGSYLSHGEKATAGVPAVWHPLPEDAPRNRLALAHWLVDERNPLTPRVIANRHWEQVFGIGLVETSEEFGSQGTLPSHPELLDWLAVELRESGWNLKAFLELLVTSATYCQASVVTPEQFADDPDNRLLARGPRFRISAEMVRDQALFVSGLLSEKRYGAPVRPPQPEMGLKAAFGSKTDWTTSEGEDRYRRGIYTTWRRSNPYPSMATFDAPNREVCTVRRGRTNTPLQALVTLNDPVYIEAAQSLARRIAAQPGTVEDRVRFGFETVLVRPARTAEIDRLASLFRKSHDQYAALPGEARAMATDPLGPAGEDTDLSALAAWTVVGNVLLNLDEFFLKR